MHSDAPAAPRYTGIGAKDTPPAMLAVIDKIAAHMAKSGYILRSGGAEGAGTAFELACDKAGGKKEIYLPWQGFNKNRSMMYAVPDRAFSFVKEFNPAWTTLNDASKKVQARYALAILGQDLGHPSVCAITYTKEGKLKGGTGQALQIAQKYNVPIFNLGAYESDPALMAEKLKEFFTGLSVPVEGLTL